MVSSTMGGSAAENFYLVSVECWAAILTGSFPVPESADFIKTKFKQQPRRQKDKKKESDKKSQPDCQTVVLFCSLLCSGLLGT